MGEGDALFFDLEFQTIHGSVVYIKKKIFMHDVLQAFFFFFFTQSAFKSERLRFFLRKEEPGSCI